MDVQNILETLEPPPKQKHRRPEPRKHRKSPLVFFTLIFRKYAIFELFWIPPKGLPFVCFDILQHNGCQKIPKGPPFTFFGTVTLFKNLIKIFLGNFFKSPKGSPSFFSYFATNWSFTAQRVPLLQFRALDIAPTLAVTGGLVSYLLGVFTYSND